MKSFCRRDVGLFKKKGTSSSGLGVFLAFLKSSTFRGRDLHGIGDLKRFGFNDQILKVESEWPVTMKQSFMFIAERTWWEECFEVSKAPIALILQFDSDSKLLALKI